MRKLWSSVFFGGALAALFLLMENLLFPSGDLRWALVFLAFISPVILMNRRAISNFLCPPFDMSIGFAIAHVLAQNPSTSQVRLRAEMNVFRGIFNLAKSGLLDLSGSPGEGLPAKRIPPRKLKKLMPMDMVIPVSEEAPEGHVYALGSANLPEESREYAKGDVVCCTNLLVKSRELYGHWPKLTGRKGK